MLRSKQRWQLHPETKVTIGLMLALLLVVIWSTFSYLHSARAIQSGKSANTGLEMLATLESLFEVLVTIDRQSIDFAKTGDTEASNKFRAAVSIARAHIKTVRKEKKDAKTQRQLTLLESQVDQLISKAKHLVDRRQNSASNVLVDDKLIDEQQELLDSVRGRIHLLESDERADIARNNKVYEEESARLFQTYALLGLLSVVVLLTLILKLIDSAKKQRIQAAADLRVAQDIVEHAPIGILILDDTQTVVSCNPTFCNYICMKREALLRQKLSELIPNLPESTVQALSKLTRNEDFDQSLLQLKDTMITPEMFWDMAIWPVMEESNFRGLVLIVEDVTRRLKFQKQKQLFFDTFAHDLKNPITGNQLLIGAILNDDQQPVSSAHRPILEELERGNEDALKMIKTILEVSKLENGKDTLVQTESFDLKSLLLESVNDLKKLSAARDIKVSCDFSNSDNYSVNNNKLAIKHLAFNLIENAIKFSDNGGDVKVSLSKDDKDWYSIFVNNGGPALSQIDRENLFTSVGQGELGRRMPGGTGIGLYLCAQLVKVLGGSLHCESDSECGTTFIARIPESTKRETRMQQE